MVASSIYASMKRSNMAIIKATLYDNLYTIVNMDYIKTSQHILTYDEILADEDALRQMFLWMVNDYIDATDD